MSSLDADGSFWCSVMQILRRHHLIRSFPAVSLLLTSNFDAPHLLVLYIYIYSLDIVPL